MAKSSNGRGCYWGWGTKANRIAWGLVVLFVLVGTAFWIPGVIEVKKCINKHSQCACTPKAGGGYVCPDRTASSDTPAAQACYNEYLACMKSPAAVWGVGWLFLVIMSWLPCCYFCCCSASPKHQGSAAPPGALYGLQMSPAAGVLPYNNGQYNYPPSYAAPQPPVPAYPAAATAAYPGAPAAAGPGGLFPPAGPVSGPPQSGGHYNLHQQPPYEQNVPTHSY